MASGARRLSTTFQCLQQGRDDAVLPTKKRRRGQLMPLEEKCVGSTFDSLHKRAATSYTATTQKFIGRIQAQRNKFKRWTTTSDGKTTETNPDLTVTLKEETKTVTGLRREIKDLEKQQAFVTLARVIKDQKKYGQTLLKHDNQGN